MKGVEGVAATEAEQLVAMVTIVVPLLAAPDLTEDVVVDRLGDLVPEAGASLELAAGAMLLLELVEFVHLRTGDAESEVWQQFLAWRATL